MKIGHVSIVARDTDRLAAFYAEVFGCTDLRPRRTLSGARISRGNGVPGSEIYAAWLGLPSGDGPFLEILQYKSLHESPAPQANQPGLGHISFEVDDIRATLNAVLQAGGAAIGEITNMGSPEAPVLCVYVRDLEGNVLELEQV